MAKSRNTLVGQQTGRQSQIRPLPTMIAFRRIPSRVKL